MSIDINDIRSQFPALEKTVNGFPVAYLDGPGGTQVPQRVIDAVSRHLIHFNANIHGVFESSVENDKILQNARVAFADFFGCQWEEVSFCHNSTTINFKLSQAIARDLKPGDEILITDIDHEANRGPWQILEEKGFVVKSIEIDKTQYIIDMEDFKKKLSAKTKVVAINYASNAVGSIADVKEMIKMAHNVGAVTIVDAVHFALHGALDVVNIDTDYLFCSAYKFFGPHVGVLYAKKDQMTQLRTLKVQEQEDCPPYKFETGTLNHEGIAGAAEAIEFISDIGLKTGDQFSKITDGLQGRRKNIVAGMMYMEAYERPLAENFKKELSKIAKVKAYCPPEDYPQTSTVSFTVEGVHPNKVATLLANKAICVWDGDFYATQFTKVLGLRESGGFVRVGLAPYNTEEELDRTLAVIRSL
ncbi:MAG: cysteine desulfurase-like protein [Deltaproteobacteria bacterium]|mgnify:FL=1|jgi:cysteine desulfurase family protein (TIGR01976 family)|nr:cysteine desulfurase-like protein [Deltaproteobacteria bacterium]